MTVGPGVQQDNSERDNENGGIAALFNQGDFLM